MNANMDVAKQWRKAQNDLLNADNNLKSEIIPYDTVCFHCQQAAEKILKAYLVSIDIHPRFTHDLLLLLEVVLPHCTDGETLRDDLASLMPYAVEVRYPDDLPGLTHDEAVEAREAAERVLTWLRSNASQLFL